MEKKGGNFEGHNELKKVTASKNWGFKCEWVTTENGNEFTM